MSEYGNTQAWRDAAARSLDAMHERALKAEAKVEAQREALKFVLATVDSSEHEDLHRRVGVFCGEAECWLCAAEATVREVLAVERRPR